MNDYGTQYMKCTTQVSSYTVTPDIDIVFADATSGNITITLYSPANKFPLASTLGGRVRVIKIDSSTHTVTIATVSGSIMGLPTVLTAQNQGVLYESDGMSKWLSFGGSPQDLSTTASPAFVSVNAKINGVKVYRALLTQAGTAAPTATVLENSLGGTVVWTRSEMGLSIGTLAGAFTANKTFITVGSTGSESSGDFAKAYRVSNNVVEVVAWSIADNAGADDLLIGTPIKILVNP